MFAVTLAPHDFTKVFSPLGTMLGTPTEGWGVWGEIGILRKPLGTCLFSVLCSESRVALSGSLEALSAFEAGNYKPHIAITIFSGLSSTVKK